MQLCADGRKNHWWYMLQALGSMQGSALERLYKCAQSYLSRVSATDVQTLCDGMVRPQPAQDIPEPAHAGSCCIAVKNHDPGLCTDKQQHCNIIGASSHTVLANCTWPRAQVCAL